MGTTELTFGKQRWIINAPAATPNEIAGNRVLRERVEAVAKTRKGSGPLAQQLATNPTSFHVNVVPHSRYLAIPEVSTPSREYVPIDWLSPPDIPSNKLLVIADADDWEFALLCSKMHNAWIQHVTGRLGSALQYSPGLVYNPFPWPDCTEKQRAAVASLGLQVIAVRDRYPTSSLAILYDAIAMPPDLRKAHHALDLAVDRLYRVAPFASDRDRVEHLFGRYEALVNPLATSGVKANRRIARKAARDG